MSLYKHIRDTWKKPQANLGPLWKERIMAWRKENSVVKIEHPTRLDRARSLGYKAKQGYLCLKKKSSSPAKRIKSKTRKNVWVRLFNLKIR